MQMKLQQEVRILFCESSYNCMERAVFSMLMKLHCFITRHRRLLLVVRRQEGGKRQRVCHVSAMQQHLRDRAHHAVGDRQVATSRCFKKNDGRDLGFNYTYTAKGWMNHEVFCQWLRSFGNYVALEPNQKNCIVA